MIEASEVRRRIVRWELLRLPFNLICVLGAWLAWGVSNEVTVAIDEMPPSSLNDPGAFRDLLFGFAILNVAYCLIYAVEFVGSAISPKFTVTARISAYAVGCVLGFCIASKGSAGIAQSILSEKKIEATRQARFEEVRRKSEEESRLRSEALKKDYPKGPTRR